MKRPLYVAIAVVLFASTTWAVTIPMDQQINLGHTYNSQSPSGDAIYTAFNTDTQSFEAGPPGFTRHHMVNGGGAGGWWYQYVDLNLADITTPGAGLNLSNPAARISFDTRFYQDAQTNTNPYGDAPVFLRIYTYAADGNTYVGYRDYGIVYATQGPWSNLPYPDWTTVTVDLNSATFTDGGTFDITNVSRVRFYGTDWAGHGDDFVDFRNLNIVIPEPSAAAALLLGGLILARPRRRRA